MVAVNGVGSLLVSPELVIDRANPLIGDSISDLKINSFLSLSASTPFKRIAREAYPGGESASRAPKTRSEPDGERSLCFVQGRPVRQIYFTGNAFLLLQLTTERASRRNELLRIRCSPTPRSRHSRNAHRGERNEHGAEPIEATRSPSFQRYRSIIRHRRRYTYTYDLQNARSSESRNGRSLSTCSRMRSIRPRRSSPRT